MGTAYGVQAENGTYISTVGAYFKRDRWNRSGVSGDRELNTHITGT